MNMSTIIPTCPVFINWYGPDIFDHLPVQHFGLYLNEPDC